MPSPSPTCDPAPRVDGPPSVSVATPHGGESATRARLERAFDLALFILEDREAALDAATRALARLRLTVAAQERRSDYVPRGRRSGDGAVRPARTRVRVSEAQLLQRLVYLETDADERRQEQAARPGDATLTRRWVKHLVRCAMRRNSFYVTLAVSRLLHRYRTAEAQDLYALVLQDPGRVPDDYYYRARKRQLIEELRERFAGRVALVTGPRGEQRFETREDALAWAPLVRECLDRFTPWDSSCTLPAEFDGRSTELPRFAFDGADPDGEHTIELDRIHALLHPGCFHRLTRALQLPPPEQRLDVPRFTNADGTASGGGGEGPRMLTDDEWQHARDRLRRQADPRPGRGGILYVSVDGGPRRPFDTARMQPLALSAPALAERVDFESEDGTLLASCLLAGAPSLASVPIGDGRLELEVLSEAETTLRLEVRVAGARPEPVPSAPLRALAARVAARGHRWLAASWPRLSLAGGAMVAVLVALSVRPTLRPPDAATPAMSAPAAPSPSPTVPQAPATSAAPTVPTRTTDVDTTRSFTLAPRARRLREIQRVYVRDVEPVGPLSALRPALVQRLNESGRMTTLAEPTAADAWMEMEAEGTRGRVRVRFSLVNASGDVVWTTRVEGDAADAASMAARAVTALLEAARQ